MKRMTRRVIGALALVAVAAGCGSSGSMSDAARDRLDVLVGKVRAAAVARDRYAADRALASLRQSVRSYQQHGDISAARATEILDAAARVETRLVRFTTTTTTTTTTLPEPSDEGHDRPEHGDKDKGHKGGKGKKGGG